MTRVIGTMPRSGVVSVLGRCICFTKEVYLEIGVVDTVSVNMLVLNHTTQWKYKLVSGNIAGKSTSVDFGKAAYVKRYRLVEKCEAR